MFQTIRPPSIKSSNTILYPLPKSCFCETVCQLLIFTYFHLAAHSVVVAWDLHYPSPAVTVPGFYGSFIEAQSTLLKVFLEKIFHLVRSLPLGLLLCISSCIFCFTWRSRPSYLACPNHFILVHFNLRETREWLSISLMTAFLTKVSHLTPSTYSSTDITEAL